MPNKVKIARLCLLVAGWLKIATAGFFAFILASGAVLVSGNAERSGLLGSALLGRTGILLALVSAAVGLLEVAVAGGVRRQAGWSRAAGILLGLLMLPLIPVWTILGLFVLSGLAGAGGREWFSRGAG